MFAFLISGNTSVQLAAREGHPKVLERLIEVHNYDSFIINKTKNKP